MAVSNNSQTKTDDFFSLIEKEQKIENPFATDEILFQDENGNLKVLKGGEVLDFDQKSAVSSKPIESQINQVKFLPVPEPEVSESELELVAPLTPAVSEPASSSFEKEIDEIIKSVGLVFSKPDEEKKFRNIAVSRLKNVRGSLETREIMLSSALVGGMGFDSFTTDKVLEIINNKFNQLDGGQAPAINQVSSLNDLQTEANKILTEPLPGPLPDFEPKPEPIPALPIPPPIVIEKPQPVQAEIVSQVINPIIAPPPVVPEISYQPHLTGPLKEISTMTLVDFRRLGSTPEAATQKVMEKIDLLEQESFAMRIAAIRAWKECEVYQLYLDLGDQSMEERKPIFDIIVERQRTDRPTLTEAELEAVIELNQKLRY